MQPPSRARNRRTRSPPPASSRTLLPSRPSPASPAPPAPLRAAARSLSSSAQGTARGPDGRFGCRGHRDLSVRAPRSAAGFPILPRIEFSIFIFLPLRPIPSHPAPSPPDFLALSSSSRILFLAWLFPARLPPSPFAPSPLLSPSSSVSSFHSLLLDLLPRRLLLLLPVLPPLVPPPLQCLQTRGSSMRSSRAECWAAASRARKPRWS